MDEIIVSDTTTLIVLQRLDELPLLCRLFEQIWIPEAVFNEFQAGLPSKVDLPPCVYATDVSTSTRLQDLRLILDEGEAEAIELALVKEVPLLIDERKGRHIAKQLDITTVGFAGLLILAVSWRVLTTEQARHLLDTAMINGFRLSDRLYRQVIDKLA